MKPAQVNKLYARLTPHEQAALAIEAAARHDESEIDAILAHVEHRHYLSTHADYTRRIHALMTLAGQYGIEYWKNRALMLIACEYADQGNQEAEAPALRFLAKAVALESAIVEVCKQLKVDVKAIKTMAGCPDDDVKPEALQKADAELVTQYTGMFAGLFTS
ncbi:hypothetical protein [Methylomonas koyamae]|uniref:hypothetical protein n=1 Tax=Methylomonas koyamae TaxID=702114 RepID=UPI0006CFC9F6|nr:hypothetical protein [Methylomonas koyamae]BBL60082.1 hypothetical protein MKFW12EY_36950 [Methylomonas koyamae]